MLTISEIRAGRVVRIDNQPYVVIKTDHNKTAMAKAVLKVKLKNLLTGNMLEVAVHGGEKLDEADTQVKKANYMYKDENEANFMDNDTFEQHGISLEQIGDKIQYLKEGTDVDLLYFDGKPVSVELPIKMVFKVVSAPPSVKGNSAGNVTKVVELETGASISVPMFINEGDLVRINTESGEYVERA